MKIKDISMMENINTIAAMIENSENNFNTEDRLLSELLEKIRELTIEAGVEQDDAEHGPKSFVTFENDLDDLINMVGMNYYIRGIKMGARLRNVLSERPGNPEA